MFTEATVNGLSWAYAVVGWMLVGAGIGMHKILPRVSPGRVLKGQEYRRFCLFWGTMVLLLVAINDRAQFFMALELVVLSGAAIGFTKIGNGVKCLIPVIAAAMIGPHLIFHGEMDEAIRWVAAGTLILVGIAYATDGSLVLVMASALNIGVCWQAFEDGYGKAMGFAALNAVTVAFEFSRGVLSGKPEIRPRALPEAA